MIDLGETLSDIEENGPTPSIEQPRQVILKSNITPSSIDIAQTCLRQYWLERRIGLKDGINMLEIGTRTNQNDLPPANVIGTIVHRLVEIGVPSPKRSNDTLPLPIEWTTDTESSWNGSKLDLVMAEVFEEYLPSGIDRDKTRNLVSSMISILDSSDFGRFLNEGTGEIGQLEGVRTEMPFGMELEVEGPPLEIVSDTPLSLIHI